MKRNIFVLLALLCSSLAFAAGLKVTSGSGKFLKDEGTMAVTFNWANATYGDDGKSLKDEWKGDYQGNIKSGEEFFLNGFNEKSKKLKAKEASKTKNAQYSMTVNVKKIDYFFSAMSFVPGHKFTIWADVIVKDASGKEVCVVTATRFKGGRDFVRLDAYTEMMEDFGRNLANL